MTRIMVIEVAEGRDLSISLREEPVSRGGAPEWTPAEAAVADRVAARVLSVEGVLVSASPTIRLYRTTQPDTNWRPVSAQ